MNNSPDFSLPAAPHGRASDDLSLPQSSLGSARSITVTALLALFILLALATSAHAQWQTPTYALRGGWNSIYLHGDATHTTPDLLFANNPEIISVWRWIPNPNPVQISGSSLVPSTTSPEWTVWVRGEPTQTTLASLPGQNAYLIRCAGAPTDTYSLKGISVALDKVAEGCK